MQNIKTEAQDLLEQKRSIVLSLAKDKDLQAFARACKSYTNTYERLARLGAIRNTLAGEGIIFGNRKITQNITAHRVKTVKRSGRKVKAKETFKTPAVGVASNV